MQILAVLSGYLIGSLLPAYFLTGWLKGVDIHTIGNGNPGTTNVKRVVGLWPAVATASYDTTKGLLSMAIAFWIFRVPLFWVYASGIVAIFGHVFPFYLKFKGGRGVATATGILIVMLFKVGFTLFSTKPLILSGDLLYLIFFVLSVYFASGDENFLAICVLPVLTALLLIRVKSQNDLILLLFLISYIFIISILNVKKLKIITIKDENIRLWRIFLRPAAMSFPIFGLFMRRIDLLTFIGSILAVFFLTDLMRVLSRKINNFLGKEFVKGFKIYKKKERSRFSSMTMFLMGVFLSFILFKNSIAVLSLGFLVFGDMMAKITGISYGQKRIFGEEHEKTLEGFLGFLSASISVSYFSWIFGIHPLWISIIGASIASIVESLPVPFDDNISVPIISGAVMTLIKML